MRCALAGLLVLVSAFSVEAAPLPAKEFNRLKKRLKIAQAQGDPSQLGEALTALAADDSERAVDLVLKVMFAAQEGRAQIYAAGGAALAQMKSPEATASLCDFATKKRSPSLLKIFCIEALTSREDPASAQALGAVLDDPRPEVLRAALKAIRLRRAGECVDGLLGLLERLERQPDELILGDTRKALIEITGKWFDSLEDWRKWWSYSKHEGQRPVTGGSKELLETAERGKAPPKFFGTEIKSERIVFVIDVSGSMEGDRLAKSKKQLMECISGLRPGSSFTVACYSNQVRIWQPKLQPANQQNKDKAISFVETLRANGNTYTLEALLRAFDTADADTIVLLSDGAPTQNKPNGERWTEEEILNEVSGTNKGKQWQIHTFGFGAAGGELVKFMKDLAEANDGTFTKID